jgi:uncharacterized protein YdaU (DUF1376 family)
MKKLWEWLFGTRNKQCNIHDVSNQFYCELDGNWAHQRCKKQCNHCKKEFKKMINN